MKIKIACALALAAMTAVFASAETKDATTINIEALARVDAVAAYCSHVDPQHASVYRQTLTTFTRSHSAAEISSDRGTSRYQFALGTINGQLGKLAPAAGGQACSQLTKGLQ